MAIITLCRVICSGPNILKMSQGVLIFLLLFFTSLSMSAPPSRTEPSCCYLAADRCQQNLCTQALPHTPYKLTLWLFIYFYLLLHQSCNACGEDLSHLIFRGIFFNLGNSHEMNVR